MLDNMILVTIPYTKTYVERSFVVVGEFYNITKRYLDIRPKMSSQRLFLTKRNGNFINIGVGINAVGSVPRKVAEFLKLPEPERYTSHCIRRTSAIVYADSGASVSQLMRFAKWKSATVTTGYVDDSIVNKQIIGEQITNSIIPSVATTVASGTTHSMGPMVCISPVLATTSVVSTTASSINNTIPIAALPPTKPQSKEYSHSKNDCSNHLDQIDLESNDSMINDSGYDSRDDLPTENYSSDSNSNYSKASSKCKHQSRVHRQSNPDYCGDDSSLDIPPYRTRQHRVSDQRRESLDSNSVSTNSLQDVRESPPEFRVGNSCFKFFNCNVTINMVPEK